MKAYAKRENQKYYAVVVANDKIAENGYKLSVSSYVEQEDTREKIDIVKLRRLLQGKKSFRWKLRHRGENARIEKTKEL